MFKFSEDRKLRTEYWKVNCAKPGQGHFTSVTKKRVPDFLQAQHPNCCFFVFVNPFTYFEKTVFMKI